MMPAGTASRVRYHPPELNSKHHRDYWIYRWSWISPKTNLSFFTA